LYQWSRKILAVSSDLSGDVRPATQQWKRPITRRLGKFMEEVSIMTRRSATVPVAFKPFVIHYLGLLVSAKKENRRAQIDSWRLLKRKMVRAATKSLSRLSLIVLRTIDRGSNMQEEEWEVVENEEKRREDTRSSNDKARLGIFWEDHEISEGKKDRKRRRRRD
jgi:hypothetical protein